MISLVPLFEHFFANFTYLYSNCNNLLMNRIFSGVSITWMEGGCSSRRRQGLKRYELWGYARLEHQISINFPLAQADEAFAITLLLC